MPTARLTLVLLALIFTPLLLADDSLDYPLHYQITLVPEHDRAEVVIETDHKGLLLELNFNIDPKRHSNIQANGDLELKGGRAIWHPPERHARLTLNVKITHKRNDDSYDALMTEDWAIFRGDNLIPSARVKSVAGAESRARLTFVLPDHWTSVSTGWNKLGDREFGVENPERSFSRPTGWMIAGRLGTRREQIGATEVVVGAPRGSKLRRMDIITFFNVVWPQVENAFGTSPPKLAVIGDGDPMWRGGLSGPNSLFLHADRPLVSENGTSSLIHELVHVVTRIRGARNHDWIAEGLAEFYSFELLYRAGAMTAERRQRVLDSLTEWSRDIDTLIKRHSTGPTTARAVLLFDQLDRELQEKSEGKHNIDDLTQALSDIRVVDLNDLIRAAEKLAGGPLETLKHQVLKEPDE